MSIMVKETKKRFWTGTKAKLMYFFWFWLLGKGIFLISNGDIFFGKFVFSNLKAASYVGFCWLCKQVISRERNSMEKVFTYTPIARDMKYLNLIRNYQCKTNLAKLIVCCDLGRVQRREKARKRHILLFKWWYIRWWMGKQSKIRRWNKILRRS